ncbi:WXG100 family type VII secretion target [Streptomyces sp. NPDC050516]|uniref:WXG100 family type VII secretion target n=1 Tax=Streptomyces sp. NPDC050516 TaxID=3365621 RepID=UPI0037A650C8
MKKLAGDIEDMQRHLDNQVRRMDTIVDRIQAGWQGPASSAYRDLRTVAAMEDGLKGMAVA